MSSKLKLSQEHQLVIFWKDKGIHVRKAKPVRDQVGPIHGFLICVHCDLDLGDMTLGQGQDKPLSNGQQFLTS